MPTPTASPTVSSTIGLKNVVIAPLEVDTEETLTYGTLQSVVGAIDASITPNNTDPDVQFADDVEFDTLYPDPELSFKTKMADLPLAIQEMIFGNKIDDNGVLIRSATDKPPYFAVGFMSEKANHNRSASDKPPYFAVGFMSEKANHKYRYIWLFKVRAKPVTENYSTKAGKTITRQTGEVEWVAIKRTHDGQYQAVADEGENGFTAEMAATFLQSVYTPTFTPEP